MYAARDEHDEARFIVAEIERMRARGLACHDVAIFYRTNAQSRVLEESLLEANIAYAVVGGVKFYDRSVQKWRGLSEELGLNMFYSTRGHYTLAHTDATLRTCRWRAEVNNHHGVDSRVVGPEEIARALPMMDMTAGGHAPILGALYHAPGAVARHDAVAWGYARAADHRRDTLAARTDDGASG